jgi:hypothetical protein
MSDPMQEGLARISTEDSIKMKSCSKCYSVIRQENAIQLDQK